MPDVFCGECRDLLEQISTNTKLINSKIDQIKQLAKAIDMTRQLQTIPGIRRRTAMAIEVFEPPMDLFKNGRALSAGLRFVLRQYLSGGEEPLGRVSKASQADIRRLLIIDAMSRLYWLGKRSILEES